MRGAGQQLAADAADGNRPPAAALSASPKHGGVPLTVEFSAAGSSDPDAQALSYQWVFGDGEGAEGVSVAHTYTVAGNYTAVLTVTDTLGESATSRTTITPGNHAPVAEILTPVSGAEFAVDQVVTFTGAGIDADDGALSGGKPTQTITAPSALTLTAWYVNALPPVAWLPGIFR